MVDDVVVTSASTTVEVPSAVIEGKTYVLRPPSYGQIGAMEEGLPLAMNSSIAVLYDAMRKAIEAGDLPAETKAAYLDALAAEEAARDAYVAAFSVLPGDKSLWTESAREDVKRAEVDFQAAQRGVQIVDWEMRDHPSIVKLRRARENALRAERMAKIAVCLGVEPAEVAALPAADVERLFPKAEALIRPTPAVEKN